MFQTLQSEWCVYTIQVPMSSTISISMKTIVGSTLRIYTTGTSVLLWSKFLNSYDALRIFIYK